jgi:membrane protease YdiL (CAAX protease family)
MRCWKDRTFYVALALGPLVWLSIALHPSMRISWAESVAYTTLLMVIVVLPVVEEIVFRGLMQDSLLKVSVFRAGKWGISNANVATSIVFAAFHLVHQPPLWAAAVFFPSLVFGWAKQRYESLSAPIVLHSFYNAGFVLLFG